MSAINSDIAALLTSIAVRYDKVGTPASPGSYSWDGARYVLVERASDVPFDHFAGIWAQVLHTMAAMLEQQGSDVSPEQLRYLRATLCGGMGSLQDFELDAASLGSAAEAINEAVAPLRARLCGLLAERAG